MAEGRTREDWIETLREKKPEGDLFTINKADTKSTLKLSGIERLLVVSGLSFILIDTGFRLGRLRSNLIIDGLSRYSRFTNPIFTIAGLYAYYLVGRYKIIAK